METGSEVAGKAAGEERESRDRLRRGEERTGSRRLLERQLKEEKGIRDKMRSRSGEEEEDWGSRRSLERWLVEEKELRVKLRRSPLADMRWSTGGGEESGELGSSVLYRVSDGSCGYCEWLCACACMHMRVRACICVCVHACMCVCVPSSEVIVTMLMKPLVYFFSVL